MMRVNNTLLLEMWGNVGVCEEEIHCYYRSATDQR